MYGATLDTLVKTSNAVLHSSLPSSPPTKTAALEKNGDEEVGIQKLISDIGILILEGRIPDTTSNRGFAEGPHCVTCPQSKSHQCDFNNLMCKRAEKYKQLIETIWNDKKGFCIELRVCSDCGCGEKQVWSNTMSRFDYVLEQWYFQVTNVRNDDEDIGVMNWYGLLQAVRSQIYFSQLSAWWSSNRAQLPKNIAFHVLPLSQIDVHSCILQHKFPVLAFGTTYLQIKLRSPPRSVVLPKIHCSVHSKQTDVVDDRMKIHCDRFGKHHCEAPEDLDENENETWLNRDDFCDGILEETGENNATIALNVEKTQTASRTIRFCASTEENPVRSSCGNVSTFHKSLNVPPTNIGQFILSKLFPTSATVSDSETLRYSFNCDINTSNPYQGEASATSSPFQLNSQNSKSHSQSNSFKNNRSHASVPSDPEILTHFLKARDGKRARKSLQARDNKKTEKKEQRSCLVHDSNSKTSDNQLQNDLKMLPGAYVTDKLSKINIRLPAHNNNVIIEDNNSVSNTESNCDVKMTKFEPANRIPSTNNVLERKSDKLRNGVRGFRAKRITDRFLPFTGNIVESVLSGRVYFTNIIDNFKIKVTSGVLFNGQSSSVDLNAASYHYHFGDSDLSKSYLVKSCISDNEKGVQIANAGQLQVSVFNTENSLIKVFIVPYDLSDMTRCTKTYIRHSNYYAPVNTSDFNIKWLQSLIQLKCFCSKSGRIYLQNEINVIIFQKSDLNTAYELQQKINLKHHNITEIAYK